MKMTDHPDSSMDGNRVETSVSKTVLPAVSSGSLTDFGVSPINQTVSPSNSDGSVSPSDQPFSITSGDVLFTDQAVSLTDFDVLRSDQDVSPAHCSASPTGKTGSLTKCGASPTDKTVSPTRCCVSPIDQTVSPSRCGVSRLDQTVSSTRCGVSLTAQTVSSAACGVPPSIQVVTHSGGNVHDSLDTASSTNGENGSIVSEEFNANGSLLSHLKTRPNFTQTDSNVQTVERHTLTPENEPYLKYYAREQTIPTSFPNRSEILDFGLYLKGDIFQCYSCGIQFSVSENSLQLCGNHNDNCLHHQVKSKGLNPKEDVFVNRNAADTEACFKCKMKIKKIVYLECHHLMSCTDCLLEDLHRGPSEPRTPGSAETSGHHENPGLHEESVACPMCGTLTSKYLIIHWELFLSLPTFGSETNNKSYCSIRGH